MGDPRLETGENYFSLSIIFQKISADAPFSMSYTARKGVRNQGYATNFLHMIAEIFLYEISSGKNLIVRGPCAGPQGGTVNFFNELVFGMTLTVHEL